MPQQLKGRLPEGLDNAKLRLTENVKKDQVHKY